VVLVLAIIAQSWTVATSGVIALQDGLYGLDCVPTHAITLYLAQHYAGGQLMEDTFSSQTNGLWSDAGIDFKNVIYEGSGQLWRSALKNPEDMVDWIIVNPNDPHDIVAQHIDVGSKAFLQQYTMVVDEPSGLQLFHRNGLASLPTHPISPLLETEHSLCRANK
jgi:hypothetical protein